MALKVYSAKRSDSGAEWLRQRHNSPYYKTLCHQKDFGAGICISLYLEKWKLII